MVERAGKQAELGFKAHPHMLRMPAAVRGIGSFKGIGEGPSPLRPDARGSRV
jgi:hypothetical protein